jgi:hypothetical protein
MDCQNGRGEPDIDAVDSVKQHKRIAGIDDCLPDVIRGILFGNPPLPGAFLTLPKSS